MNKILTYSSVMGLALLMAGGMSPELRAQETEIEEIAVTGTRIRGANPDSFSPVAIITEEDIQISGSISIGELL